MCDFFKAVGRDLAQPGRVIAWVVIAVLGGVSGPFGTYDVLPFAVRVGQWALIAGAAFVVVLTARRLYLRLWPGLRYVWISLAVSLTLAIVLTPAIEVLMWLLVDKGTREGEPPWRVFLIVFFLALSIDLLRWFALQSLLREVSETPRPSPVPRLAARLPEGADSAILALSARDHMVIVHTARADHPLRMRLSDAISEMEGVDGFCTHRSHWVAAAAVTGTARENSRPYVLLSDGTKVPVSRKYRPDVEARGFL